MWLHGIGKDWQQISVLSMAEPLGNVKDTAANMATRIRAHVREAVGKEVEALVKCSVSDNAGNATNVAPLLHMDGMRCYAHTLALAPSHLNFPCERTIEGHKRMQMHERAVPAAYELMQKARAFCRLFDRRHGHERPSRELEAVALKLGRKVLAPQLDSSAEWSSTFAMLDRLHAMKYEIADLAAQATHRYPDNTFFSEQEWLLMRDIVGVLRPFKEVTSMIQASALLGSVVLPVAFTLECEMACDTPTRVAAGDADHIATMPLPEDQLAEAARSYRVALRQEVGTVMRHLEGSREALVLSSAMDPRFKHLLWADSSETKSRIRSAVEKAALELDQIAEPQAAEDLKGISAANRSELRPPAKRARSSEDVTAFEQAMNRNCNFRCQRPVTGRARERQIRAQVHAYFEPWPNCSFSSKQASVYTKHHRSKPLFKAMAFNPPKKGFERFLNHHHAALRLVYMS